jgi:hypothetical protein
VVDRVSRRLGYEVKASGDVVIPDTQLTKPLEFHQLSISKRKLQAKAAMLELFPKMPPLAVNQVASTAFTKATDSPNLISA